MTGRRFAVTLAAIGFLAMAVASKSALADTTTLVCTVGGGAAAPGKIVLDETKGTITIQYPPAVMGGTFYPVRPPITYAAKFNSETITFVGGSTSTYPNGEPITIDRQTGVLISNGVTWTCHVGQKQF